MRKLLCLAAVLLLVSTPVIAEIVGLSSELVKTGSEDAVAKLLKSTLEIDLNSLPGVFATKEMLLGMSIIGIVSFLSFLVLALFAVAFFPTQLGRASYYSERMGGKAFLWGLLMIALIVPTMALLAISLIGIAFIPAYLILLAAAVFFGYVAVSQLLGKKILKALKIRNKPMMVEVTVGLVLFALIGLLPIVGWLIKLIAATMGLGAVFATRFGITD